MSVEKRKKLREQSSFKKAGVIVSFDSKNSNYLYSLILPVISGLLFVLIHPPISLFPVAYVALVPLLCSLNSSNLYKSFLAGTLTGITGYLGIIYWVVVAMNRYGGLDIFTSISIMLLLVLYVSFYIGVFCYSICFLESRLSVPFFLSAPCVWVLLEYIRDFLLTGFPWALIAYSQYNFLPFIQITSITGVYFISFMVVSINCILQFLWTKKRIPIIYTIIVGILFLLSLLYGFNRLRTEDNVRMLNTSIIQGNFSQDIKWDDSSKAKTIKKYYQLTLENSKDTHLVIWPETAMPFAFNTGKEISDLIRLLPSIMKTNLLFGTVYRDDAGRYYNSAYILNEAGETAGIYNKVHLVPFGEYTPLLDYIPFLSKITAAGGNFTAGSSHEPIKTTIGDIGVLICFEGIFPKISNETVRKGAQVLVNITNDAWYDRTSAPFQHLSFYVFRAIETDRYLLRSANTGISAIIDPRGRIKEKTPIFEEAVLKGKFGMKSEKTFYLIYGDWFIYATAFVLFFGTLYFFIRKKARQAGHKPLSHVSV